MLSNTALEAHDVAPLGGSRLRVSFFVMLVDTGDHCLGPLAHKASQRGDSSIAYSLTSWSLLKEKLSPPLMSTVPTGKAE